MFAIAGAIILVVGVLGIVLAIKRGRATARDEFSRRNAAGVLEYESFEDSLRARQRKMVTNWIASGAAMMICIGGVLLIVGPPIDRQNRRDAESFAEADLQIRDRVLAERCVEGDEAACREWCTLPGTRQACIKNWGRAEGPR